VPSVTARTGGPQLRGDKALWLQVADHLRETVRDKTYQVGERFPTETELIAKFGVSRTTIRAALAKLVQEQLLERGSGRGSFVRAPVERPSGHLSGFHEDIRNRGFFPSARLITFGVEGAPDEVCTALGEKAGAVMMRVQRVILADQQPISFHDSYLPSWIQDETGLAESDFTEGRSLYDLLDERASARPATAVETITAVSAAFRVARLLETPVRSPLLKATRVSKDSHERLMEFTTSLYRADLYGYRLELSQ
jgi:GntR family transcriptional regulator